MSCAVCLRGGSSQHEGNIRKRRYSERRWKTSTKVFLVKLHTSFDLNGERKDYVDWLRAQKWSL